MILKSEIKVITLNQLIVDARNAEKQIYIKAYVNDSAISIIMLTKLNHFTDDFRIIKIKYYIYYRRDRHVKFKCHELYSELKIK